MDNTILDIFCLTIINKLNEEFTKKLQNDKVEKMPIAVMLKEKKLKNKVNIKTTKNIKQISSDLENELTVNQFTTPTTFRSKRKLKKLMRKNYKLNKQINNGYYKALTIAIKIVKSEYVKILKESEK